MAETFVVCPGCGLNLQSDQGLDKNNNASCACLQLYWDLSAFTLSLRDDDFPHQLAVDSYAAQHYGPKMKPVTITFALIGLYLTFEREYTGKEVQQAHILLGKLSKRWPNFNPINKNNEVKVRDVVQNITKDNYKELLSRWGKSVWDSWKPEHEKVRELIDRYLNIS